MACWPEIVCCGWSWHRSRYRCADGSMPGIDRRSCLRVIVMKKKFDPLMLLFVVFGLLLAVSAIGQMLAV